MNEFIEGKLKEFEKEFTSDLHKHDGCSDECSKKYAEARMREDHAGLFRSALTAAYHQALEDVEGVAPKAQKACSCEDDGVGYHSKDCSFFPQGWNACREEVLKRLEELKKKV